jgi:hypothetical protein
MDRPSRDAAYRSKPIRHVRGGEHGNDHRHLCAACHGGMGNAEERWRASKPYDGPYS